MTTNEKEEVGIGFTVLAVVLIRGRAEGEDLPANVFLRLGFLQSNPRNILLGVLGWQEAYTLNTGNDKASGDPHHR